LILPLEKLNNNGSIVAVTGEELLKGSALGGDGGKFAPVLSEGIVVPNAVYQTVGTSYDVLTEVVEDLYLRYGKDRLRIVNNEPQIIEAYIPGYIGTRLIDPTKNTPDFIIIIRQIIHWSDDKYDFWNGRTLYTAAVCCNGRTPSVS